MRQSSEVLSYAEPTVSTVKIFERHKDKVYNC